MIDLVNSNAAIYSTEYAGLDRGRVVKQDANSIVVEFVDPSNYITLTKHIEYDYPAAFLDNRIIIRGNANDYLIHDIELNKQLDAVLVALKTLGSKEDLACKALLSKRDEIKKELADNIRAFDEDIKDSQDKECKIYIARDESEIEEELLRLADRIDNLVFLKNEIDNYSGFKLSKKYKNLKEEYESELITARSVANIHLPDKEKKLQRDYEKLGLGYAPRYASLDGTTYETLVDSFNNLNLTFEKVRIGNRERTFPHSFFLAERTDERAVLRNNQNYYFEYYLGPNERIKTIEKDSRFEITESRRYEGGSPVRSVTGTDDNSSFYFSEESVDNDNTYSFNIFKQIDKGTGNEDVEYRIWKLEEMTYLREKKL